MMKAMHEQLMPLWLPSHKNDRQLWQHPMTWGVLLALLVHGLLFGLIWARMSSMAETMVNPEPTIHIAIAMISHPQPPASRQPEPLHHPNTTPEPVSKLARVLTAPASHRQEQIAPAAKPRHQLQRQKTETQHQPDRSEEQHPMAAEPHTAVIQQTGTHQASPQVPLPVDATAIHCTVPHPDYPPKARWLHEEGMVRIQIVINELGQLTHSTITQHSGSDLLDQAAMLAIQHLHCQPFEQQGHAVQITTVQPFMFHLAS